MEPQTIVDQPIPLIDGSVMQASGNTTDPVVSDSGAATPSTQVDKAFPPVVIAQETISQSLNTATKVITANYTFESLGAITIGSYVNGISGQIQISPNGIVATNVNGVITFTIDGTTGNATFLGTVQAGSVITGDITVGGASNGDGQIHVLDNSNVQRILLDKDGITINKGKITIYDDTDTAILDATGLISTANFLSDAVTPSNQTSHSGTTADVSGSSLTFSLSRTTHILITLYVNVDFFSNGGGNVYLNIDGSDVRKLQFGLYAPASGSESAQAGSFTYIYSLASGPHTIKLRFQAVADAIVSGFGLFDIALAYVILGS